MCVCPIAVGHREAMFADQSNCLRSTDLSFAVNSREGRCRNKLAVSQRRSAEAGVAGESSVCNYTNGLRSKTAKVTVSSHYLSFNERRHSCPSLLNHLSIFTRTHREHPPTRQRVLHCSGIAAKRIIAPKSTKPQLRVSYSTSRHKNAGKIQRRAELRVELNVIRTSEGAMRGRRDGEFIACRPQISFQQMKQNNRTKVEK